MEGGCSRLIFFTVITVLCGSVFTTTTSENLVDEEAGAEILHQNPVLKKEDKTDGVYEIQDPISDSDSPDLSSSSICSSPSPSPSFLVSSRILSPRSLLAVAEMKQSHPGDDPSLALLLVTVVRREMQGCSLVVAADGGFGASLVLREVLRLPNLRQASFLSSISSIRREREIGRDVCVRGRKRNYYYPLSLYSACVHLSQSLFMLIIFFLSFLPLSIPLPLFLCLVFFSLSLFLILLVFLFSLLSLNIIVAIIM